MRTIDLPTANVTQEKILAKITDGILDGSVVTSLFFSNARPFMGNPMSKNLKYAKSTAQGWYTGIGNFNVTQQKNRVKLSWTPSSVYGSVTLPYLELSVNKSLPVIQQETLEMQSAAEDLLDSLGDAFYGSGTGAACDGLLNIVDDGTVASNYANQSRTTYPGLNADVSSSVGSISLDTIGSSIDGATVGAEEPGIILTTKTLWRAIEDLLFPSTMSTYGAAGAKKGKVNRLGDVGAGEALKALAGYTAMYYRGIPIVKDAKCPSGNIFYINRKFTYWAGLPHYKYGIVNLGGGLIEGVDNEVPRNHGISWSGMKSAFTGDGETGQFILYGQMICESPRLNALDSSCTA